MKSFVAAAEEQRRSGAFGAFTRLGMQDFRETEYPGVVECWIAPKAESDTITHPHREGPPKQRTSSLQQAGDKRAPSFRGLQEMATEHDLDIVIVGDDESSKEWAFLREGLELARTHSTKTRVDVTLPLEGDEPVTILPALETIKKGQLVVNGKDAEVMVRRFVERLAATG